MTPDEFRKWRLSHNLTQGAVAKLLGVSTRSAFTYDNDGPIPLTVQLACERVTEQLRGVSSQIGRLTGDEMRDAMIALCDDWSDPEKMQEKVGQMNGQEQRAVKAVLTGLIRNIRTIDAPPNAGPHPTAASRLNAPRGRPPGYRREVQRSV